MKRRRKKFIECTFTISSLVALAAINYSILHSSIVFLALIVLIAHELGHYLVAKSHNLDARLPIFIPLPFILIAATKVPFTDRVTKRKILLAGPVAGALTALFLSILALLTGAIDAIVMSLLTMFITEIVFNFFGSDGRRFRSP